jgi:hypothetical protein
MPMLNCVNIIDSFGFKASGRFDGPAGVTPATLAPIDPDVLYHDEIKGIDESLRDQGFTPNHSDSTTEAELDIHI